MNQIACPYCRGVISGQGIAPGQLLVCPHCGRQFVRPGGAPEAQAAAPAPERAGPAASSGSIPAAAAAPARVPTAAAAPARAAGAAQPQSEPGYGSQYAEQRHAQSSMTVVWIIVGVVVGLMLLGLLVYLIMNRMDTDMRAKIEPQLYEQALKHVTAKEKESEVREKLGMKPGDRLVINGDRIDFSGDVATVYIKVKGQNRFITVKFHLSDGEWSLDGPINVTSGK